MGHLHDHDKAYLVNLRANNILEEVEPSSMDLSNGIIIVACADGDQFEDYYSHIAGIAKDVIQRERVHVLALNGGAFLLSESWPSQKESEVLKNHLHTAVDLKEIHTVVLYGHAPCGAAGKCNFDVPTVLYHLAEAKDVAKSIREDIKVICFLHVDWGEGKKRTYHFSRDKYRAEKK